MSPGSPKPEFAGTQRFEIVRSVGSGGTGVVYEAFDRERNVRVALKVLKALDAEARLQFKSEFRALQDIRHPNLVSLGELHEEGGQLFFTMELVRGVDFVVHVRVHEQGDEPPSTWRTHAPLALALPLALQASTPASARASGPPSLIRRPTPRARAYPDGPGFDEARLRAALVQLVQGLCAIHRAEKVHRDIKTSNVLVTAEGRVVILDFGLVADMRAPRRDDAVVGTAHFMAPEMADGKPVGPEADLYAAGVMLYVALTGVYPFQSSPQVALDFKRVMEPPRPSQLVPGLPPDLEALCVDLLRLDPAARPSGREVLHRLQAEEAIDEPPVLSQRFGFVGRRRELEALDQAFAEARAGRPMVQIVEGESGIGKSALMRRFLERIARGTLVLSGRCYERESVPYKAVDDLIDALSLCLAALQPEEAAALLPRGAGLLGAVFPVLRKVEAIAAAPVQRRVIDPPELRALVFAALRELFGRLAAGRPLVLAIDDLQWADADSLALLTEVMRPSSPAGDGPPGGAPPPRPILLLASIRTDPDDTPRLLRRLALPSGSVRRLALHRLPAGEAQELCALLLRGARRRRPISVEALVEESGGHPLFIDALVRYRLSHEDDRAPVRLDEALWDRIGRLDSRARELLELAAIAGGPLPLDVATHAAGANLDEVNRLISILRAACLVRTGGAGREEFVEPYHNRIRETVLGRLAPEAARVWHGRLALALELSGRAELTALAEHWRAAGDAVRAVDYAVRAAEQAEEALAFERAALLYRMAVDLLPHGGSARRAVLARLGDALSSAGQGARAAEAYMAASDGAPASDALDLGRRAAEGLFWAGYVDAGMAGLGAVLAAVGLKVPRTPEQALASLMFRRAQIRLRGLRFEERDAGAIPGDELSRIDVCWSAALGLAIVDPIRGADFQALGLLLALKSGEPYRITRALAFEAVYDAATSTASEGPTAARVAELLRAAHEIAARIGRPHALGLARLAGGMTATFLGRFREAAESLDRADSILREDCTGVAWERGSAQSFAICALWYLGDVREFARRVPLYLQAAEERGDRYLATRLRSAQSNAYWLVQGDPDAALLNANEAIRSWSKAGFHLQIYFDLVARGHIGLYRGEGEATHRLFVERWPGLEGSLSFRIQVVRVSMLYLRACAAITAAAPGSAATEGLLMEASRAAGALEAEDAAWSAPLGLALRAAVTGARSDREAAARLLGAAVRGFDAAGMALYAAAARRRRGELAPDGDARAAAIAADRWMRDQGIADPERMAAALIPGARG